MAIEDAREPLREIHELRHSKESRVLPKLMRWTKIGT